MKFKNICVYLILFFSTLLSFCELQAFEIKILPLTTTKKIVIKNETEITRKVFFKFLSENFKNDIPKTYQYINLKFKDVDKDPELKQYLQILIYLDIVDNNNINIFPSKPLNAFTFYNFIDKKLDLYAIPSDETEKELKNRTTRLYDLQNVKDKISEFKESLENADNNKNELSTKQKIFTDVYETLLSSHFDKDNLTEDKLVNSAIE
jgi:hypothetical protein